MNDYVSSWRKFNNHDQNYQTLLIILTAYLTAVTQQVVMITQLNQFVEIIYVQSAVLVS